MFQWLNHLLFWCLFIGYSLASFNELKRKLERKCAEIWIEIIPSKPLVQWQEFFFLKFPKCRCINVILPFICVCLMSITYFLCALHLWLQISNIFCYFLLNNSIRISFYILLFINITRADENLDHQTHNTHTHTFPPILFTSVYT